MAPLASKVLQTLRERGLGAVLRQAARRIYHRRVMVLFDRDLGQSDEVPFLPRHPFVVRFLDASELDLIAPHVAPERLAHYRRRLAQGMKVSACLTGDERECLGWVWTTDQPYYEPYDNATYRAVPRSFLHIDGEVVSEKRGRGVAFTAFPLIWPHWRALGHRMCHCTVDAANRPSMKLHDRMNYRPVGEMTVHTLLGFRWIAPAGPRLGPGDETGHG